MKTIKTQHDTNMLQNHLGIIIYCDQQLKVNFLFLFVLS